MAFGTGRKVAIGLALASAFALGGCYDDGYGYGGVNAGYGYCDDGYYGGGPGYYAGGYGYPGYGWYNGFYYPGTGFYVYDRGGNRRRWNDDDRRYWDGRRGQAGFRPGGGDGRPGYGRPGDGRPGDGRPGRGDGQSAGRPGDGRPDGQPGVRPDGTPWQGREGWRGNRGGQQNADGSQNGYRGRGMWGGNRQPGGPQVGRSAGQAPQAAAPTRAPQSFRNDSRGGRGGRGSPQR